MLDWTKPREMSREEGEALARWYRETHGEQIAELMPFMPLLIEEMPSTFKRYRRFVEAIVGLGEIPGGLVATLFLHHYMLVGNERGAAYEVDHARDSGLSKGEVLDVARLAFLEGGPFSVGTLALRGLAGLRDWEQDGESPKPPWPRHWAPEPAASDADFDYTSLDTDEAEADRLVEGWPGGDGAAPAWTELARAHAPGVLKAGRFRAEQAFEATELPIQAIRLIALFRSVIQGRPEAARLAVGLARRSGVNRSIALQTVFLAYLYANDSTRDATATVLVDEFDAWSEG
jgi:hypothetical protein